MQPKTSIKIIKRAKRESPPPSADAVEKDGGHDSARHMTSTVTGWVREFRSRRHAERKRAFDVLSSMRAPLADCVGD